VRLGFLLAAMLLPTAACAATSFEGEQRDYILSRPHGWVELEIADEAVPMVPSSDEAPNDVVRPDSCDVEVRLDREPFAWTTVYPSGDRAPYIVESGLRFPAPVGPSLLSVDYSKCDVEAGKQSSTKAQLYIAVPESKVVEVYFDGSALAADPPREDSVVTLDDIYQAVAGRKKAER